MLKVRNPLEIAIEIMAPRVQVEEKQLKSALVSTPNGCTATSLQPEANADAKAGSATVSR